MTVDKPLQGLNVLITREEHQAETLVRLTQKLGGKPISIPLISFKKRDVVLKHDSYDWLVFTSVNSVNFFQLSRDRVADLGSPKIAVIGEKTKGAIEKLGLQIDFVPRNYVAEDFMREFLLQLVQPSRVLFPKGNLARDVIPRSLRENGHECHDIIVYETVKPVSSKRELISFLNSSKADILTFTSSSTIANFMQIINKYQLHEAIKNSIIACIGPVSKNKAEALGLIVHVCPDTYTVDKMMDNLVRYIKNRSDI